MQIRIVQDAAARFLKENASTVLTAGGVVGTVATGILAFRAGRKYERVLTAHEPFVPAPDHESELSKTDKVKLVAPHLIPPVVIGGLTVSSIVGANMVSAKRAAILAAAYGMSQKQFEEYKAKAEEKLGLSKSKKVKEEIAQDRVEKNPPPSTIIIMGDEVLCYDKATDRYFKSTVEKIRRAELATNAEISRYGCAKAQFFYSELEIDPTTWTKNTGWNRRIEVEVHHALTPDERPCLTIDFDHPPDPNYELDYS